MTAPAPQAGGWVERAMQLANSFADEAGDLCLAARDGIGASEARRATLAAESALRVEILAQAALTERLAEALKNAVGDSQEVIARHVLEYGENYKAPRLKWMREQLAEAEAALTAYQKGTA